MNNTESKEPTIFDQKKKEPTIIIQHRSIGTSKSVWSRGLEPKKELKSDELKKNLN